MFKFYIIITCLVLCFTVKAQKADTKFFWGINGHPLTQSAYAKNWDDQFNRIKDLNLNSYRFDVLLNIDGTAKKDLLFNKLLTRLKNNNIMPLPVVSLSGLKGLDSTAIYQTTYNQGVNFAQRYGSFISVMEVNNEVDNKIMLPGDRPGLKASDYDPEKTTRILTGIKGFIDGVKKIEPSIKFTLSVSYIHFYYLQLLKNYNVNYDIIGCHWYSSMGDITNFKAPFGNIITTLTKRFNKPVWITEFNHSKGTTNASFAKQNEYISTTLSKVISQNLIGGIYVYELYDQPAIRKQYPFEACYGLIQTNSFGNVVEKDAYTGYKQVIQKYK
jgi:hypothetical protein